MAQGGFKIAQDTLKIAPRKTKWAQDGPKISPRSLKIASSCLTASSKAQVASLIRAAGVVHDVDPAALEHQAAKPY